MNTAITPLSLVIHPNEKNSENKNNFHKNSSTALSNNSQSLGEGRSYETSNLKKSLISAPTKFDLKAPTKSGSTTVNSVTNVSINLLKTENENQISSSTSISTSSATLLISTDSSAAPVSPATGSVNVTPPTGAVLSSAAAKRLQNKKSLSKT